MLFLDLVFVLQFCKAVSFGGLGGFSLSVCSVTGIICNHGRKQGENDESGFHGRDVVYCPKSESWSVSVQHTVKSESWSVSVQHTVKSESWSVSVQHTVKAEIKIKTMQLPRLKFCGHLTTED